MATANESCVGGLILAGGQSLRMGCNKALLRVDGSTFLERVISQLRHLPELLLSVDSLGSTVAASPYHAFGVPVVEDHFQGSGPLGGICSALRVCRSDALFVAACDMPLLCRGLVEYLLAVVREEDDACIFVDRSGREHPLCGIYRKRAVPCLEAQLATGDFRMRHALARLNVRRFSLEHAVYPDETLANINTPEEYARLRRRVEGPPIIAVSGVKNSGKTTLLAALIPVLRARGLIVAAIKHDGHDFEPDVPGTDSSVLRLAGARSVAVYSDRRYLITEEKPGTRVGDLAAHFTDADVILLEGGKSSAYPKLEVVRGAASSAPACDPDTVLALCTDIALSAGSLPVLALDDYEGMADCILRRLGHDAALPPRGDML